MAKALKDNYPNRALFSVTMSAANTLTFRSLVFGTGIFEKVAVVVHRLEYRPSGAAVAEMTTSGDGIYMALTRTNTITTISDPSIVIYDSFFLERFDMGAAASGNYSLTPKYEKDFSTMPGGGLIIPSAPIYMAMNSSGLASAAAGWIVMYFTLKTLSAEDYIELVESLSTIT